MPSYFPEGNTPRPTDSFERLLQKAASLVSARNGGADAPSPDDSRERTMYKFVKGLSASISESSNLDPDALAYAVASGAADVVAIDAFVKGVKSLGLWNNMVCWPLRSRQNAGTGTVVHSLGGLGTFNGSIVNGATWGTSGIELTDTTQQITRSGFDTPASPMTFGFVNDKSDAAAAMRLGMFSVSIAKRKANAEYTNQRGFDLRNSLNQNYATWLQPTSTDFVYRAVSITGNLTADGYVNGSPASGSFFPGVTVGWNDSPGDSQELLYGAIAADATIRVPIFWVLNSVAATSAQHSALYTLYKSTLGTGLGLP